MSLGPERARAILAGLPERISHVLRPWARTTPDALALIEGDRRLSYAELAGAVGALGRQLAGWSVRPGDRVMLVGENSAATVAALLACADLDAWPVIVNARLTAREIDGIREHSGARRVLYTIAVSDDAARHAERHGARPVDLGALGPAALGPLAPDVLPEPVEPRGDAQVGALIYTSGTTGAPKAVMLTHRSLLFVAGISGAMRELDGTSRVYAVLPVSHVFGLASMCLGTLFHGGALLLARRFDPALLLAAVEQGEVTVFQGVPAMFARLVEQLRLQGRDRVGPHALRYISVGGAPLDASLKRGVERAFGLPLNNGYGLTETAPTIAQTRTDDPRSDCSNGPLLPGVEARLVGAEGREVGEGGIGELHVRGPGVMKGYYRAPDETARVLRPDGWLNTGDLAQFDEGQLTIVGRTKELIIRSGFNVYPPEVEAVLNTHPDVVQSAVVGRRVMGNEEVVAFVQAMPGSSVTVEALQAHAARHLAPYKRPSELVILDALPASSTGKVLKGTLAAIAAEPRHVDLGNRPEARIRETSP